MNKRPLAILMTIGIAASAGSGHSVTAASANAPTLGDWLARDSALRASSAGDPEGDRLKALHQDIVRALVAAQAADDADRAAGRAPASCKPKTGSSQLTADDIGKWLRTRPPAEHRLPLADIMKTFLRERLQCQ